MAIPAPDSNLASERALEKRTFVLVAALALIVALAAIGTRGLYETTEGRFAEVAREMLESGNWLEPQAAYRPHYDKPPLSYWAMAAGMSVFGVGEVGVRAGNALAFVLSALGVVWLGALLWDRRTGLVAGLVYATSAFPAIAAGSLSSDGFVTLFEIGAMLAYVCATRTRERRSERRWVVLVWFALGLAFLAKGTAGLLPLAPILLFDVASGRRLRMASPVGLLVFCAVGLGWYVVVVWRNDGLLSFLIDQQITGRLFRDEYNRNPQWYKPFTMYLPLVVFGAAPWVVVAARDLWAARRSLLPRALRAPSPGLLLAAWIVPPLVVFSLARSRLPLYVLPLAAPVALAVARSRVRGHGDGALRRAIRIAAPTAVVLAAALGASGWIEHPSDMRALARFVRAEEPGGRVYAFGEDALHGLRFYLGGDLTRLSASDDAYADRPLAEAIREMRVAAEPSALVTRPRRAAALRALLEENGIGVTDRSEHGWSLLIASPARPAADAATP